MALLNSDHGSCAADDKAVTFASLNSGWQTAQAHVRDSSCTPRQTAM